MIPEGESPIAPGYRLDRYEMLCPIAEGGMASVWIARQRGKHGFQKLVAIKTILPKFASDEMFQQMFLDEARIAAGIEHTNVAQVLDLGDEQGILYLVMEWVDGDSLLKLHRAVERRGKTIPCGILLRILADACAGLSAAHQLRGANGELLGVVHRDVSPQNILVSTKGVAKVIDFGIAKARDRVAVETSSGVLKGKVQYMSPEQAVGAPADARADIWAIGAVLYYLTSGRLPFDAPNQMATLHLLSSGQPPLPLPPTVPRCVRAIAHKALSFRVEDRYQTMLELQHALEQAMVEEHVSTKVADVAAFVAEHLADRAERRKNAIEAALEAAADRARVRALVDPTAADSAVSGVSRPGRSPVSIGGTPAAQPQQQSAPGLHQPLSETSSASLGHETRASLVASMPPGPGKGTRRGAIVVGGALAIAGLVMMARSRGPEWWAPPGTRAAVTQSASVPRSPETASPPTESNVVSSPKATAQPPLSASAVLVDAGAVPAAVPISKPAHPAEGARARPANVPAPPRAAPPATESGGRRGQADYGF
jgi:serine/threonine-protein kinase